MPLSSGQFESYSEVFSELFEALHIWSTYAAGSLWRGAY